MRWLEAGAAEGLRVGGEAVVAEPWPAAVVVVFSGFRDGRGFSLAATLRERGFTGELIASGDVIPDQAAMLKRVGFDAVELPAGADAGEWERAAVAFSAAYQSSADGAVPVWKRRQASRAALAGSSKRDREAVGFKDDEIDGLAASLNAEFREASAEEIVRAALARFRGRAAVLSSFGAEAAVTLRMAAEADPSTPVLFLDTERHFEPTLQYRDRLVRQLGLTDLRVLKPRDAETHDPRGDLWRTDPDGCCALRKVRPLAEVAAGFDVLITGRKRLHGGARVRLPAFERVGEQVRVNPLANWSAERIESYFVEHALPKHPLTQGGYRSIGCWPCTQPSSDRENVRAGRWAGVDKTECGIHMPERWAAELDRRAS